MIGSGKEPHDVHTGGDAPQLPPANPPKVVEEIARVKADVAAHVMVNAQAASANVILIVLETNVKESVRASVATGARKW